MTTIFRIPNKALAELSPHFDNAVKQEDADRQTCPECGSRNGKWRDCPECKGKGMITCDCEGSGGDFGCNACGFYNPGFHVEGDVETRQIVSKLRNPHGLSADEIKAVRLAAADKIESLLLKL